MTSREYRQTSGALHEVRVTADGRGRLVADVMKYNVVDDYRTTFTPRCFSASLETRMPRILWSHNAHDPIGQWIDADDTSERLRLAGVLDLAMVRDSEGRETGTPAVPSAHRAWAQLSSRTIDQFSVGFLRQAEERNTPRQGVTAITQALLDEASPILVGSVPGAELVSIRSTQRIFDMGQGRRLRLFPSETRAGKGGQFAKGGGRVPGSGGGGAPRMNSGAAAKADYAKGLAKTAKADDEAGLVKYKTTGVKAKLRPQVKKLRRQAEDAERQATIHEKNLQRDPNGPLARADKESARFLKKHAEELKAMADELEKDSAT